jgi:protease I
MKMKKILILVENIYEDMELHYPKYRLQEAGYEVVLAGEKKGEVYKGKHGYPCTSTASFEEVKVGSFSGLVIPGGYAPDKLRKNPKVLELVRTFHEQKKPIAFICHGGWVPISAGILRGVMCTSYDAIRDDIQNAGGLWENREVVVDGNLISSRHPDDLPAFCIKIIEVLSQL